MNDDMFKIGDNEEETKGSTPLEIKKDSTSISIDDDFGDENESNNKVNTIPRDDERNKVKSHSEGGKWFLRGVYNAVAYGSLLIEPAFSWFLFMSIRETLHDIGLGLVAEFGDPKHVPSWLPLVENIILGVSTAAVVGNLIRDVTAVDPTQDVFDTLTSTETFEDTFKTLKGKVLLKEGEEFREFEIGEGENSGTIGVGLYRKKYELVFEEHTNQTIQNVPMLLDDSVAGSFIVYYEKSSGNPVSLSFCDRKKNRVVQLEVTKGEATLGDLRQSVTGNDKNQPISALSDQHIEIIKSFTGYAPESWRKGDDPQLTKKEIAEGIEKYIQQLSGWQIPLSKFAFYSLAVGAVVFNYLPLGIADSVSFADWFGTSKPSLIISSFVVVVLSAAYYDLMTRGKFKSHSIEFVTRFFSLFSKEAWTDGFLFNMAKSPLKSLEAGLEAFTNVGYRSVAGAYIAYTVSKLFAKSFAGKDTFEGIEYLVYMTAAAIGFTTLFSRSERAIRKHFPRPEITVIEQIKGENGKTHRKEHVPVIVNPNTCWTDDDTYWYDQDAIALDKKPKFPIGDSIKEGLFALMRAGAVGGFSYFTLQKDHPYRTEYAIGAGALTLLHAIYVNFRTIYAQAQREQLTEELTDNSPSSDILTEKQLKKATSAQLFEAIGKLAGNDKGLVKVCAVLVNLLAVASRQISFVGFLWTLFTAKDLPIKDYVKLQALPIILLALATGNEISKNDFKFYQAGVDEAWFNHATRNTIRKVAKQIENPQKNKVNIQEEESLIENTGNKLPSRTREIIKNKPSFFLAKQDYNPEYLEQVYKKLAATKQENIKKDEENILVGNSGSGGSSSGGETKQKDLSSLTTEDLLEIEKKGSNTKQGVNIQPHQTVINFNQLPPQSNNQNAFLGNSTENHQTGGNSSSQTSVEKNLENK